MTSAAHLSVRARRTGLTVLIGAALLAPAACTSAAPTASPTTSAASSSTSTADPTGQSGLPEGGLTIPGIEVAQSVNNDPALPISIGRPIVPGQAALTDAMKTWADAKETAFRGDYLPSPESAPELNITWQVAMANGSILGVRLHDREFAGASGQSTNQVFYGDAATGTVKQAVDLITAGKVDALAKLVWDGAAKLAAPIEAAAPTGSAAARLLTDLVFAPDGTLTAYLDQGSVAAYSAGNLTVTVPGPQVTPLLSDFGRAVQAAVASGAPYAVPATVPAAPSTPAEPVQPVQPAQPAPPAQPAQPAQPNSGAVDCSTLKCVALTFDDGPGAYTGKLLDSLAASGTKVTFFVLGQNVKIRPDIVARAVAAGHVVANHTWDHRDMKKLSATEQATEVSSAGDAIRNATGVTTTLLRPPYGSFNESVRGLGQAIIMWDVDTLDWKYRDSAEVTRRALADVKPGSIILMHDIHATSVDAVPGLVSALAQRGYTLVTVPQLLGSTKAGSVYYSRSRAG